MQSCVSDVEIKGQETEDQLLSTRSPDLLSTVDAVSQIPPTLSANRGQVESTASPQPAKIPPPSATRKTSQHPQIPVFLTVWSIDTLHCLLGCGAVLTDLEGSLSSPNHPGSYPPNLLCMWVIQVPPPFIIQIHVLNLAVEGPSPCLFDWLEVQEQIALSSVVTRSVMGQSIACLIYG